MGIKEFIKSLGHKQKEKKEMLARMSDQVRMQKIVEERQLSSNERELNRLREENREEIIKEELEVARKKKQEDINFGHNPLNTENITNKTEWEVLKEKNQFSKNENMFANQGSILKNNHNLLRTNKDLLRSNKQLLKGGNMFKV